MLDFLRQRDFDPVPLMQDEIRGGFDAPPSVRELPFIFVFGRAHWTVSLYGANVYVENIMVGLEQQSVSQMTTGKFKLRVVEDELGDSKLELVVELARGATISEQRMFSNYWRNMSLFSLCFLQLQT
jgi:phenylacetate-CoA ligase